MRALAGAAGTSGRLAVPQTELADIILPQDYPRNPVLPIDFIGVRTDTHHDGKRLERKGAVMEGQAVYCEGCSCPIEYDGSRWVHVHTGGPHCPNGDQWAYATPPLGVWDR